VNKLIKFILIIAITQAGIYFYLDRVVLVPSAKYSQQAITDVSKLPVDPEKVSTDQKYYAKLQTTGVKFYTIDNTLKNELALKTGESVSYFSWVPDTDLALIGISRNTAHGTSVSLKSVNMETNSYPVEPKISGLASGSKITEVASSSQINVTYILIKSKITTLVYRTDANNNLRKVISHTAVRRIASLQSVDMLLYDNKQDGKVYALSNKGKWKMISPKVGNYALIGSDKDDNIYIGRLNGSGVISSILKGDPKGNFAQYKSLDYLYPVTSVTVNYDGKLQLT
jgi:hypothetical protein